MEKMLINGPTKLNGSVRVSRAKNAYLPILAGVLLCEGPVTLKNVPELRDINTMKKLLGNLGVKITGDNSSMTFDSSKIEHVEATYDLVKTMRASICVLGPLLTRFHEAKVSLPGGCAIGSRPIDIHLSNLELLGAEIILEGGYVHAKTKGLKGTSLVLEFPSVGATENILMAAVLAKGNTKIENCALEPEVTDLANFLNAMGAKISGIGTKTLLIEGVEKLTGGEYEAIGDRIEAATYIIAGLMTESEIEVTGFIPEHLEFVINKLKMAGAKFEISENAVKTFPSKLEGIDVDTAPYPGFPTDVQAQFIALATYINGSSVITENIFENRFMHVPELTRMGADITLKGNAAIVKGGKELIGAPVMCTDLRASAALILAALVAQGETEVQRVYHLDRGYEKLAAKFKELGANIKRMD
ncbi:UDP-N-acetylglucosamine 1-carboxyvinyltransferase [Bacteriovoracaceae bacterium]|nr:UDP-N-acetylglucosamine 1-carboxyvinyltransferase [Bacteriovoracaceae bacterium]